jgi:hypothetical protein
MAEALGCLGANALFTASSNEKLERGYEAVRYGCLCRQSEIVKAWLIENVLDIVRGFQSRGRSYLSSSFIITSYLYSLISSLPFV